MRLVYQQNQRLVQVDVAATLTLVALAALILNTVFGSLSALVFLAFGGALAVSDVHHSAYMLTRWWFLLLLPAYCMLSTLWSAYPAITLRHSSQLMLSLAIGVVIAGRVSAPTLMRGLFVVYGIGIVASLLFGYRPSGAAWLGIFGSKNAFAAHIAVFALIAVATACDRDSSPLLRIAALGGAVLAGPLLILAQSAGAIMMVVPCIAIILLVMLTGRLSPYQKLFLFAFIAIAMAVLTLVVLTMGDTLLADVLEGSGKDPTLTGRTDLWATGQSFIAERPLQGVGYRAFWVVGFAPAEELWSMFFVPSGAGFNFHNTYISNGVELGFVGLGLQIFVIYGGAALIAALAIIRPTAGNAFLLSMQVLVILRSFIEVEVFFEFSVRSILTLCTFIYAVQGLRSVANSRSPTSGAITLRPQASVRSRRAGTPEATGR